MDALEESAVRSVDGLFDGQYKPLTGDLNLALALAHLIEPCSCIVETGTFYGNTTQWFRRVYPDKLYFGVEIDKSKWDVTREHAPDAAVYLGDSVPWLQANIHRLGAHPFFFLDAHGYNDVAGHLHIEDELNIVKSLPDPIIFIHDFNDESGAEFIPGNTFGGPVGAFATKRPDLAFYICSLRMRVGSAMYAKPGSYTYWKPVKK